MKILVIQTAFMGDMVLCAPLLTGLKRAKPGCEIAVLAAPAGARVAELLSPVDRVISFDKHGADRGPLGFMSVAGRLRREGFDAVICPHRSLRSGMLAMASGARIRCGFSAGPASLFMTRTISRPGVEHSEGAMAELADLQGTAGDSTGAGASVEGPILKIPQDMLEKAEGRIGGGMRGGPLVTLVVGSNWETKRWPSSRFAFLARELVARGMHVAVEGGPGDAAIGKEVMSVAGDGVTDLTGNSIAEAAAMISISDLVIGGDTGLAQLARLAGRRVLMIFGPTDHSIHHFGPGQKAVHAGVPCRPCSRHGPNDCPEKHFSCMYSLSTDMVLHEALALFQ